MPATYCLYCCLYPMHLLASISVTPGNRRLLMTSPRSTCYCTTAKPTAAGLYRNTEYTFFKKVSPTTQEITFPLLSTVSL